MRRGDEKIIAVAEDGTKVTAEMVESWNDAYDGRSLPTGYEYDGPVKQGRPRMFEGGTSTVVVRIPSAQKDALEHEAKQRGMTMSGYVREILAMRNSVSV